MTLTHSALRQLRERGCNFVAKLPLETRVKSCGRQKSKEINGLCYTSSEIIGPTLKVEVVYKDFGAKQEGVTNTHIAHTSNNSHSLQVFAFINTLNTKLLSITLQLNYCT